MPPSTSPRKCGWAPPRRSPLEQWDRVLDVNLKGVYLCCRAVIPVMKAQRRGKILTVASGTFFSGAGRHAALHGVEGRRRGADPRAGETARALGHQRQLLHARFDDERGNGTPAVRQRREAAARGRAFARIEEPDDVVGTALFLASADSDYMTGQVLVVEGGGILHDGGRGPVRVACVCTASR